ncbi:MAG: cob(I)yrinic acid a,c-diamide adenosyltransferase [Patescibacteria group bacterium]|nr:cob(I)yrinic acid a,c-diamide adenosyltransferase [Patescibacteria group bacterium]
MTKIYTRKGDKGKTSLFGGKCVQKSNSRVEAYGTVDELNSVIGIVITQVQKSKLPPSLKLRRTSKSQNHILKLKNELTEIQKDLFEIGTELADQKSEVKNQKQLAERIEKIEKEIDEMAEQLPEIHNFIIPGGGEAGSLLHFCRAICRRAERRVVALSKKEKINKEILIYLNRLSDFLFISARFVNKLENKKEIVWRKEI